MCPHPAFGTTLAALLIMVAGCASGEDPGMAPAPEAAEPTLEMIEEGNSVFHGAGNCASCHGANAGGGSLGPDLTDDSWVWADPSSPMFLEDLAEITRSGIEDPEDYQTPMPPMGGAPLTDAQVQAVAAYVASLN